MESKKHDPFLDLSLDIPERFYKDSDGRKPCSIADCLSSFTEVNNEAIRHMGLTSAVHLIFFFYSFLFKTDWRIGWNWIVLLQFMQM